jgi:hypothetical protein
MSIPHSIPVFHCTDVYGKHSCKLSQLYSRVWGDLRLQRAGASSKGDARRLLAASREGLPQDGYCRIAGEPFHDVIALRKLVSPSCNDCCDFVHDYSDMIWRLSAKPPPSAALLAAGSSDSSGELDVPMSEAAEGLLRACVQQPAVRAKELIAQRPAEAEVVSLLSSSGVLRSSVWKKVFDARPPRGTIARLARRCGASLHSNAAA